MAKTYQLSAWIQHEQADMEDVLEERVKGAFKHEGIKIDAGPVVSRIYPCGDTDPLPYYPSNTTT